MSKKPKSFVVYNSLASKRSEKYVESMRERVTKLVEEGLSTYAIAKQLNQEGYRTIRGKVFTSLLVWNLLNKLGLKTAWTVKEIIDE